MKLLLSSGVLPPPSISLLCHTALSSLIFLLVSRYFYCSFSICGHINVRKNMKAHEKCKEMARQCFPTAVTATPYTLIPRFPPSPPSLAHAKQAKRSSCEFSRARKRLAAVYGCKRAPQGAAANRQLVTAIRVASVFIFRKYWHSLRPSPLPRPARMLEI